MATTSLERNTNFPPHMQNDSIMHWCLGSRQSHARTLLFYVCNVIWTIAVDVAIAVAVVLSVPFAVYVSLQAQPSHVDDESVTERCARRFYSVLSRCVSVFWRVELSLLQSYDPAIDISPSTALPTAQHIRYVALYILVWKTFFVLPATTTPIWICGLGLQSLLGAGPTPLTASVLLSWSLYLIAGCIVASVLCLCIVHASVYMHARIAATLPAIDEETHLLRHGSSPSSSTTYESLCDLKSPQQGGRGFRQESPRRRPASPDAVAIAVVGDHVTSPRSSPPPPSFTDIPPSEGIIMSDSPVLTINAPVVKGTKGRAGVPGQPSPASPVTAPVTEATSPRFSAATAIPISPKLVDVDPKSPSHDHVDEVVVPSRPDSANVAAAAADVAALQADLSAVQASIAEYEKMLAQGPNNKLRRRLEKERKGFEDRRQKLTDDIAAQEQPSRAYVPIATSHHIEIPTTYAMESPPYGHGVIPTTINAFHTDHDNSALSSSYLPPTHSFQPVFNSPVFRGTSGPDTWGSPVAYSHSFLTASPAAYDSLSPPGVSSMLSTSALSTPAASRFASSTIVPPVFRSLAPPAMSSASFGARQTPSTGRQSHKHPHAFANAEADEPVHMVAYAPPSVEPASEFTFAVWAFLASQRDDMHEEASASDPSAAQMSRDVLFPLRRGARAHVSLQVPHGFSVVDGATTQALTWSGAPSAAQFGVVASDDVATGQVMFKATVVFGASVMHLRAFVFVSGAPASGGEAREMAPLQAELEMLDETFHEIPYASLQLKELVGRGFFGDAYRADYLGRDVVVKTIRATELGDSSDKIVEEFRHEAAVLNMFGHHPNIVPFVGASTDFSQPLTLVTEYLPGGNLEDRRSTLTRRQKLQVLVDAAAGFLNIHDGGFIHRDVAARNCLVDASARAKVCDFGMCRRVNNAYGGSCVQEGVGPLKYMAPESLQPPYGFSTKSDAYSFGVLMWETFAEEKPFGSIAPHEAAARVLEGVRLDVASRDIPPECASIMAACFQEDPAKRPSMQAILVGLINAQSTMA